MKIALKQLTLFIFAAIFLSGCEKKITEHHDSFLSFGTVINVTLMDLSQQQAENTFRSIREDFKIMHRVWHVWEPSPVMRTNLLLKYQTDFSVAPSVIGLFQKAKKLSIQSQNLFNPAIGELIALWGFHSHKQATVEPAKQAILKLVKQNPSMHDILLNGVRMRAKNKAVKLDFGGVAKGFALDQILKDLKLKNIHNALIDTGGDLKVIGKHGKRAWKIAIRDPRNKQQAIASLELNDNEAAFTSGDYERYIKSKNNNDKHLHHIIDPRTGYPAIGTQSVTVLHHDAATADAAATALFIAGPKEWVKIARAMKIKYVLLIDENGDIHSSTAMKKRITLQQNRNIVEEVEI